ncbi:hypothetical protein C8039_17760 [Halogeometricum sp. wsp3]|nr:hypothetical protein C8039_17760 [Halogeometricum sp. wsp3]
MVSESIPELLELLLSTLLAAGLTVGGALTEQAALADLTGGAPRSLPRSYRAGPPGAGYP